MSFQCSSCGASVDVPPDVMATSCQFCDSPLVDVESHADPVDRVVPFTVDAKRAAGLLTKHLQQAWLAPETIRKSARPTDLRAVFVPFYVYDAQARTTWDASVGVEWQRTETYTTTNSKGELETRTRTVTETEWFPLSGTHAKRWQGHLVSASRGLPESEANELEPYDLGRSQPFGPAWLAGHVAEHPTIDHGTANSTARAELEQVERAHIANAFLPGDKHSNLSSHTTVEVHGVQLMLLPVWIAVAGHGDTSIRMLVNGQTGEVVATLPTSWAKIAVFVALFVAFFLALLGFFYTVGGA